MTAVSGPSPQHKSPFADRLADWTNDDLLLTAPARTRLEAEFPGASRVFDWPELRQLSRTVDIHAGASRKRRRRNGVICAALTAGAAALSAILPLAEPLGWNVERGVYVGAAVLAFVGFLATLWLTMGDSHIRAWLESRLVTERLRQLYFQYIGADPALAAAAMSDDAALAAFRQRRDAAFAAVTPRLTTAARAELSAVAEDVNQHRAWLLANFEAAPAQPLVRSPALDAYFVILRRQRLGVQADYMREKLAPGFSSPRTQHAFIKTISYVTALLTIFASILIGIMLFNGATFDALQVRVIVSLLAFIGVIAMFFRLLGEGLQVRADLTRYSWYRAAVSDLDARYNDPDPNVRIALLREMERASYREMREFLHTHTDERFSFG